MKFSLASDVHLVFGHLDLTNEEGSDVLVLAGDIFVANEFKTETKKSNMYRRFIEDVTGRYGHVVYIMGNHEHYHGDFAKTADVLRNEFKYFNNLKFLDNTFADICDVRFIGGTLWTDLNKGDPLTIEHIKRSMNDYQLVENSNNPVSYRVPYETGVSFKTRSSKFNPIDGAEEHKKCLATISEVMDAYQDDKKIVVVTHHLPTFESVPHEYRREYHGNGAYVSDLSNFILDRPRIKYWIHGHTHDPCDYMVGDNTRVICNPRGYIGYETIAKTFKIKQYEV